MYVKTTWENNMATLAFLPKQFSQALSNH